MLFNGGLVPSYILISKWLGLKDSIFALIIPGLCGAWNILMMKGFFQSIPTSLIESAKLDGAGEFRIFTGIIIPISKPAFATIGLFFVLAYWNEWYFSMLYIDTSSKVKLQYLLMTILKNVEFLNSPEAMQYGMTNHMVAIPTLSARMAMCVIAAGPILVVFPFFQKYFVKGLTVGAVKG
jgi:putative aldouronate transport system permease protein